MALVSKRVLITGITGFTGKHLSKYLLAKGYEVFGTTIHPNENKNYFLCDLRDREQVQSVIRTVEPTHIIHTAGISFPAEDNISLIYDTNLVGTCHLLEALSQMSTPPEKIILASSANVYGDQGCEVLDETMCPHPANHYGISKLAMEHAARGFFAKLPILIVRPFNYTGIGQPEHFLVPKIISHFKRGEKNIELGNINVAREFNDVIVACEIYTRLLESDARGEVFNLCSGQAINLTEVLALMNMIAGYEIDVHINPAFVRANEIGRLIGSTEKLYRTIGEITPIPLEQTLRTMYEA